MLVPSGLLDLEGEPWQSSPDGAVEDVLVLLGPLHGKARSVVVPEVSEKLRPCLHEVDLVAVALLRLLARRQVVRTLGGLALGHEAGVLPLEQVELTRDELGETAAPDHVSSR